VGAPDIHSFRMRGTGACLKFASRPSDDEGVQKSVLVTGLSLAFCGLTLVGVGEWAAGRFENAAPDGGSAGPPAATSFPSPPPVPVSAPGMLPDGDAHLPAASPEFTFRHNVPEVRLQFTVADAQGRTISDLSPDQVRVYDNQTRVARFSDFEQAEDLPLEIGLLIDTSDSVKRVLAEEKAAAAKFLDRLLRPRDDSAFVMAFGGDVKLWQRPTHDRQLLSTAIEHAKEPGWGTRFYDALYAACDGQLAANDDSKPLRRALVVLSDGDDTQSSRGLRAVIGIAEREAMQIYFLVLRPGTGGDRGDLVLQRLADATGGRVYFARSSAELDGAFAQIERDLRTQYYVSFPPQERTPGYHSLRVEVRAPQRVEVRARQGYYASLQ